MLREWGKREQCPSLGCSLSNRVVPLVSLQIKSRAPRHQPRLLSRPPGACLARPPLSAPEDQHKAHRSIPALGCFGEDTLSISCGGDRRMGESRLDLHPRLKLELSRCRSLLSLSIPLGPGLSIVKLKELSLHIPTDGIWAEQTKGRDRLSPSWDWGLTLTRQHSISAHPGDLGPSKAQSLLLFLKAFPHGAVPFPPTLQNHRDARGCAVYWDLHH